MSRRARAVAIIGETIGASERDHVRIVTLDESDDRGAGRGDIAMPVARQQEFPVAAGHEVGAEGHLDDEVEAQFAQHADHLRVVHVDELGGKAGGHAGGHALARREQGVHFVRRAAQQLGVLRADAHAIPAGNTTLADHLGLALGDADRLDGALPHARVAHAAAFLEGRDVCLVGH